jgi:hypothetical protein
MIRPSLIVLTIFSLSGCGLAETAATGATGAAAEAEQASQAQKTEQQVKDKVEAAQQLDADRRHAADANETN